MAHLQGAHPRQAQYNLELCWGRIFPHTHKRTLKLTASVTQPMRLCLYKAGPPSVNLHNTVYSSDSCLYNILRACVKPNAELWLNRITELRKYTFKVQNWLVLKESKLQEDLWRAQAGLRKKYWHEPRPVLFYWLSWLVISLYLHRWPPQVIVTELFTHEETQRRCEQAQHCVIPSNSTGHGTVMLLKMSKIRKVWILATY